MPKTPKLQYDLTIPPKNELSISQGWLKLSLFALAFAGFYAIMLVLARTPFFQAIVPWKDFFHTALIIHVDLSVLVWLASISAMLWHTGGHGLSSIFSKTALALACFGTLLIAFSPFSGDAKPLLNNYVPILQNSLFFLGLSVFACGIIFQFMLVIINHLRSCTKDIAHFKNNPLDAGVFAASIITLTAGICFALAYNALTKEGVMALIDAEQYYEYLFWGGGHILQFTFTLIMLVGWLWMASNLKLSPLPSKAVVLAVFALHTLIALPAPLIYTQFDILSWEHTNSFTQQMRHGGGLASMVLGLYILYALLRNFKSTQPVIRNVLFFSLLLFGAGGMIGYMIGGVNTIIPAHYHGSIVGVTLALMGIVYLYLPKLGYAKVEGRMARLQPVLYGGGQLIHIIGFAWSGGYGALRKTPGAMETIEAKIAMGFMGLGGMISIIGGLFFLIVVLKCMKSAKK
jgi:tetrahydromethanopterin S-methyltransferase subunit F